MQNRRFFIFARSGNQYGMGHISRMITLAEDLVKNGVPVSFITNEASMNVLPDRNFSAHFFNDQQVKPRDMIRNAIQCYRYDAPPVVIVDDKIHHDTIGEDIEFLNIPECPEFSLISVDNPADALASYRFYDLVIVPNNHHDSRIDRLYRKYGRDNVLYGFDYVIINRNIYKDCGYGKNQDLTISYFAGGTDPDQYLHTMHKYAGYLPKSITHIYLAGGMASYQVDHYSKFTMSLIASSHLLVSRWGVTVYEAMALGTPVVVVPRNQVDFMDALELQTASIGAVSTLPVDVSPYDFSRTIRGAMSDRCHLDRLGYRASSFVDGYGSERIARKIINKFCQ